MKKCSLCLSIIVIGLLCHSLVFAGADAKLLLEKLEQLKTFQAQFQQVTKGVDGDLLQQQAGHMMAMRPNRFRWQIAEPYNQLIVCNGEKVWIIDDDLEQVTVQGLDQDMANTPALLLSGHLQEIETAFNVVLLDKSDHNEKASHRFQLMPIVQSEEGLFASLTLYFYQNRLTEMVLLDHLGQLTQVTFQEVVQKQEVKSALFSPTIPAGYDVIEQ